MRADLHITQFKQSGCAAAGHSPQLWGPCVEEGGMMTDSKTQKRNKLGFNNSYSNGTCSYFFSTCWNYIYFVFLKQWFSTVESHPNIIWVCYNDWCWSVLKLFKSGVDKQRPLSHSYQAQEVVDQSLRSVLTVTTINFNVLAPTALTHVRTGNSFSLFYLSGVLHQKVLARHKNIRQTSTKQLNKESSYVKARTSTKTEPNETIHNWSYFVFLM